MWALFKRKPASEKRDTSEAGIHRRRMHAAEKAREEVVSDIRDEVDELLKSFVKDMRDSNAARS